MMEINKVVILGTQELFGYEDFIVNDTNLASLNDKYNTFIDEISIGEFLDEMKFIYIDDNGTIHAAKELSEIIAKIENNGIVDIDFINEISIIIKLDEDRDIDLLNQEFLDSNHFFRALFIDLNGDMIKQAYDGGEYETGYFSSGKDSSFINNEWSNPEFIKIL